MVTTKKLTKDDIFDLDSFDFGEEGRYFVENWQKYNIKQKDFSQGDILDVECLEHLPDGKSFTIVCENGMTFDSTFKKEKKFFSIINPEVRTENDIIEWLNGTETLKGVGKISVCVKKEPNGNVIGSLYEAYLHNLTQEMFSEIKKKSDNNVYEAHIKSKNNGGFLATINGIDVFLPGSLAAANKLDNFDSMIGKKIKVMVEDYLKPSETFIVSHKKYISSKFAEEVEGLDETKLYKGKITGFSNFGTFLEFEGKDVILTGLLYSTEMTEENKDRLENSQLKIGNELEFYIKEVSNKRIILTQRLDSREKPTYEEFKAKFENSRVPGIIMGVKDKLGTFIRFDYEGGTFIGLLHVKDYPKEFIPTRGNKINVNILNVDVENKKIFLKA